MGLHPSQILLGYE